MLQVLRENNLCAKLEKCQFERDTVDFVGFTLSGNGISMSSDKTTAIRTWKPPTSVKGVQSFLGFANFYRRFIQNYSKIAKPLTDITRRDTPFVWTAENHKAFEDLKRAITSGPILKYPDPERPFILETDASDFAIGAALAQEYDGLRHPVAFYSRKLNETEQRYTVHDRELLAIIDALKHWRHHLIGTTHQVQIFSDHQNLAFFQKSKETDTVAETRTLVSDPLGI